MIVQSSTTNWLSVDLSHQTLETNRSVRGCCLIVFSFASELLRRGVEPYEKAGDQGPTCLTFTQWNFSHRDFLP